MTDHNDEMNQTHRQNTAEAGPCPTPSALARQAAGRSWFWQRHSVSDHLGRCHHCADEYQVLLRARDGLAQALARHLPERESAQPRWGLALASVVAVAAIAFALIPTQQSTNPMGEQPLAVEETGIFGGEFESVQIVAADNASDSLFSGDFDKGAAKPNTSGLFTDEFGG